MTDNKIIKFAGETQPVLRVDRRGRVRFGHNGHRIEVTKSGVRVYERGDSSRFFNKEETRVHPFLLAHWFTDTKFVGKLRFALNLVAFSG